MNNRGIVITSDGEYALVKSRKSKREYMFSGMTVVAKDKNSAKCKHRSLQEHKEKL